MSINLEGALECPFCFAQLDKSLTARVLQELYVPDVECPSCGKKFYIKFKPGRGMRMSPADKK